MRGRRALFFLSKKRLEGKGVLKNRLSKPNRKNKISKLSNSK